jgi:hypothetical protein
MEAIRDAGAAKRRGPAYVRFVQPRIKITTRVEGEDILLAS